jgi:hypothetical protein
MKEPVAIETSKVTESAVIEASKMKEPVAI